jgi:hypothetical protein
MKNILRRVFSSLNAFKRKNAFQTRLKNDDQNWSPNPLVRLDWSQKP